MITTALYRISKHDEINRPFEIIGEKKLSPVPVQVSNKKKVKKEKEKEKEKKNKKKKIFQAVRKNVSQFEFRPIFHFINHRRNCI